MAEEELFLGFFLLPDNEENVKRTEGEEAALAAAVGAGDEVENARHAADGLGVNFFRRSPANGVVESLSEVQNSVSVAQQHDPPSTSGTPRPTRPPLRPSRNHVHGPILGS
ncbi:hypothetical protein Ahy_B07g086565 isoform A [Arachis hypogaea]|uniref:Uncharacterized protein n=1 Tax=Arachis hypogaea TaxID=3818 RepID=A0A444YAB6_ARAHY|nr:hypothetical protein Ahy_B07g086565 isoform A [Arachis hypogaea]